jgi:hypothetical protein
MDRFVQPTKKLHKEQSNELQNTTNIPINHIRPSNLLEIDFINKRSDKSQQSEDQQACHVISNTPDLN